MPTDRAMERCRRCKKYYHKRCEAGLFDARGPGNRIPPENCGQVSPK